MYPGLDTLTWWVQFTVVGLKDMCDRGVGEGREEAGELFRDQITKSFMC